MKEQHKKSGAAGGWGQNTEARAQAEKDLGP